MDSTLHPYAYRQHCLDSVSYEKGGGGEEELRMEKEMKVVLGAGCDDEVQDEGRSDLTCIHGWDY